jgi:hypothetical protein
MSRRSETQVIPAREETREVEVKCELCDRTGRPGGTSDNKWKYGYDVEDTTISLEEGDRYPEGTNLTVTTVDICPDCMRSKVFPWLVSQGAILREKEVEY